MLEFWRSRGRWCERTVSLPLSLSLSLSLITWLLAVFVCYQRLKPPLLGLKWRFGISNGGDGWDAEEITLLTIAI